MPFNRRYSYATRTGKFYEEERKGKEAWRLGGTHFRMQQQWPHTTRKHREFRWFSWRDERKGSSL